jgi:hypothetical protein
VFSSIGTSLKGFLKNLRINTKNKKEAVKKPMERIEKET